MTTETNQAPKVGRLLLLSGWLEIGIGLGHNVLGTLILMRPRVATPIVASMGWPMAILTPIVPPEQLVLVLAMSLSAGTCWMLFGAILVWQGRTRAAHPDVPLLALVLVHQLSFLVLMVLFVRFHVPGIVVVALMVVALSAALARALGVSR